MVDKAANFQKRMGKTVDIHGVLKEKLDPLTVSSRKGRTHFISPKASAIFYLTLKELHLSEERGRELQGTTPSRMLLP